MPDLFISYSREDRETAQALAEAMQQSGIDVWWDHELTGGGDFADEIEQNLMAALVVIVLWSPASVRSEFVRDESSRARDLKKLLPVRIAAVELPLGFGTLHTLDLLGWSGDDDDDACNDVINQVRQRVSRARQPAGQGGEAGTGTRPSLLDSSAEDTLGKRRLRRRLMGGAGFAAVAGAIGVGWLGWSGWQRRSIADEARRRSEEHFRQGIGDQFAQPPLLERAAFEYNQAVLLDPGLAPAHYYLAHLYAQMMLRGSPPPNGDVLEALRTDARRQFELALAYSDRLDGSQRVIAKAQFALLDQADEAAPLARAASAAVETVAAADHPPPAVASAASLTEDKPSAPGDPVAVAANDDGSGSGSPSDASRPAPTAAARLARVRPAPELQQAAQRRGEALFGGDRDSRLAVTTTLTLQPALAADTLPAAMSSAIGALRNAPGTDATQQGVASTLALLGRAGPSTLRENASALLELSQLVPATDHNNIASVKRLLDSLSRNQHSRPVVYIQISDERQRGIAQALSERLGAAGYTTPGIENTGPARAPGRPAVRSQGASDPDLARWCQRALASAVGAPADLNVLRSARAATDTYELWFDAALCAPDGRSAPGCT